MKITANKITVARTALVPVFLVLAYCDLRCIALAVYVIACLSDYIDGYIARRYDQISTFGQFMDPLADKVLVLSAMCFFVERGQMPGWAVAVVLVREFAVSGLRLLAAGQGNVIAADISGKIKTVATMICLGAMLVFSQTAAVNILGTAVIVITTLYSGAHYFLKNKDVFKV